ncbi:MAG: corrinoid protein [Candidatus Marinimicrobia bacterium]|nr:corrinoid protein [Candidatus Neomarinimicrobiota bacterium]
MLDILEKLAKLVEAGKIDKNSPFPPALKGQDGADELTAQAVEMGINPQEILNDGLIKGMNTIGEKFSRGEAYIPNMLISAKAMNAAMVHLEPFFKGGNIQSKGTVILGTVQGDLHDIGKNLVALILQGAGWKIVDLGTDVTADKFIKAIHENQNALVGMSALLTTTMVNMEGILKTIRTNTPNTKVYIGGAPVSQAYADSIGADGYFADPFTFAKSI